MNDLLHIAQFSSKVQLDPFYKTGVICNNGLTGKNNVHGEKSDTVPLCPPKFPHREPIAQTQTSVVRSQCPIPLVAAQPLLFITAINGKGIKLQKTDSESVQHWFLLTALILNT